MKCILQILPWLGPLLNFSVCLGITIFVNKYNKGELIKDIKPAWYIANALIFLSSLYIYNTKIVLTANTLDYFYSTVAQSLAALFALTFALVVAFSQLNKNRLKEVFTKFLLAYIVVFLISICIPILAFGSNDQLIIKIILNLSVASILYLIPYLWRFKAKYVNVRKNNTIKKS